jgi:hypothetical protein
MTATPTGSWSPVITRPIPDAPAQAMTEAEERAVIRLLKAMRPHPVTVVIGAARDPRCADASERLAALWHDQGGVVLDTVTWPEHAASWLRQAHRLIRPAPDAWIVAGLLPGFVQLGRRLALSTGWDPARTVATASLAHESLIANGGIGTFDHLRGARRDGSTWEIIRTLLIDHPHPEHPTGQGS